MAPGEDDEDDQSMGTTGEIRREGGKASDGARELEHERERLVEAQREAERRRDNRDD